MNIRFLFLIAFISSQASASGLISRMKTLVSRGGSGSYGALTSGEEEAKTFTLKRPTAIASRDGQTISFRKDSRGFDYMISTSVHPDYICWAKGHGHARSYETKRNGARKTWPYLVSLAKDGLFTSRDFKKKEMLNKIFPSDSHWTKIVCEARSEDATQRILLARTLERKLGLSTSIIYTDPDSYLDTVLSVEAFLHELGDRQNVVFTVRSLRGRSLFDLLLLSNNFETFKAYAESVLGKPRLFFGLASYEAGEDILAEESKGSDELIDWEMINENAKDRSLLALACQKGRLKFAKLLMENGIKLSEAYIGDEPAISLLLRKRTTESSKNMIRELQALNPDDFNAAYDGALTFLNARGLGNVQTALEVRHGLSIPGSD